MHIQQTAVLIIFANNISSKIQHMHRMRTKSTSAALLFQTKYASPPNKEAEQETQTTSAPNHYFANSRFYDGTSCKKNTLTNMHLQIRGSKLKKSPFNGLAKKIQ